MVICRDLFIKITTMCLDWLDKYPGLEYQQTGYEIIGLAGACNEIAHIGEDPTYDDVQDIQKGYLNDGGRIEREAPDLYYAIFELIDIYNELPAPPPLPAPRSLPLPPPPPPPPCSLPLPPPPPPPPAPAPAPAVFSSCPTASPGVYGELILTPSGLVFIPCWGVYIPTEDRR